MTTPKVPPKFAADVSNLKFFLLIRERKKGLIMPVNYLPAVVSDEISSLIIFPEIKDHYHKMYF